MFAGVKEVTTEIKDNFEAAFGPTPSVHAIQCDLNKPKDVQEVRRCGFDG